MHSLHQGGFSSTKKLRQRFGIGKSFQYGLLRLCVSSICPLLYRPASCVLYRICDTHVVCTSSFDTQGKKLFYLHRRRIVGPKQIIFPCISCPYITRRFWICILATIHSNPFLLQPLFLVELFSLNLFHFKIGGEFFQCILEAFLQRL